MATSRFQTHHSILASHPCLRKLHVRYFHQRVLRIIQSLLIIKADQQDAANDWEELMALVGKTPDSLVEAKNLKLVGIFEEAGLGLPSTFMISAV